MDRRRIPSPNGTRRSSRWPPRVAAEAALSAICAALAVLTFFVPDWIEEIFGFSPDEGSGEAEWGIVLAFAVAALVTGWLARRDWRRWVLGASSN